MKRWIKRMVWRSGVLHRERDLRACRRLTVAMFHRVLPRGSEEFAHAEQEYAVDLEEFDACLAFFKQHHSPVSLDDVLRASRGEISLPDHPLLISFDDGWADNVEHAEPLLKKHGLRATLFINVEAVEQPGLRWWQDALVEVAQHSLPALQSIAEGDFYTVARQLLAKPLAEREPRLAGLSRYKPVKRQMLDEAGVRALDRSVWDVGSHALTHVPLTYSIDVDAEVQQSAARLAGWRNEPVVAMAYPHGRRSPAIDRIAAGVYPLLFSSDARLNPIEGQWPAVLGRIHIPSAAVRDESGHISEQSLAYFLWRRASKPA